MSRLKKRIIINREVSWLQFNQRGLQEAADKSNPLINRMRFLGIYSNNLDEFFRVRVATVTRMIDSKEQKNAEMSFKPTETLKSIKEIDKQLQLEFTNIYNDLVKELKKNKIFIINEKQVSTAQSEFIKDYFRNNIRPSLFPLMLDTLDSDDLHDHALYLLITLKSDNPDIKDEAAVIEVPVDDLSRFVLLPSDNDNKYVMFIDDIIRYCLDQVFSVLGYTQFEAYTVKFTRDAELDFDNDVSKSFIEQMSKSLKQRQVALPIRIVYDKKIPKQLLKKLFAKLNINQNDTISPGGRYHNLKDLMKFPNTGDASLEYPPQPPLPHPWLKHERSLFKSIREKDFIIHFPYQSFEYIIDLLREASIDPNVSEIKMTLYRVANQSKVINALINAARNGKFVTVFLEVQARFDEEANIKWASVLQKEGVKIIPGIPGYKVHSKLLLVKRNEDNGCKYYAGIGTGNFNETTGRLYSDCILLTADDNIGREVDQVFYLCESRYKIPKFDNLIVAPFYMRNHFTELIDNEIKNAEEGKPSWIFLKLNSLVDTEIVNKLYEASNAGVNIKLIVRGICVLEPGVKNMSENIKGISIVGRYLEHTRVIAFCNNDDNLFYISSADWMVRNFDNRIEVAVPIYDPELQNELLTLLNIQWADNTKARVISSKDFNKYVVGNPKIKINAQTEIYNYFRNKVI
ncbi:MAG: polyphosphate kinase 1 [Lentimicrobiaceae bacterium]|nr:polyphosphate kinase 1 [Lentimicrobiaceae bacterium]